MWTILDRTKGMNGRETMGERLFRMTFLRKIDTVKKITGIISSGGRNGGKNNMGSVEFFEVFTGHPIWAYLFFFVFFVLPIIV